MGISSHPSYEQIYHQMSQKIYVEELQKFLIDQLLEQPGWNWLCQTLTVFIFIHVIFYVFDGDIYGIHDRVNSLVEDSIGTAGSGVAKTDSLVAL